MTDSKIVYLLIDASFNDCVVHGVYTVREQAERNLKAIVETDSEIEMKIMPHVLDVDADVTYFKSEKFEDENDYL